jgi:hypothetical protein
MLLAGPFNENYPVVSPDGRWLAYSSDESGREEIYLRPLHGEGTRRQVSRQGGTNPVWGRSGRELFFHSVTGDSLLSAKLILQGDALTVQSIGGLFSLRTSAIGFDVFPGDSLFVEFEPPAAAGDQVQPAVVVYNFDRELEERLRGTAKP